jgi:hypothetical protein
MLRAFGLFLLVFSLFSLVVHLDALGGLFGIGALSMFAIDQLAANIAKSPRSPRMRGEPLL